MAKTKRPPHSREKPSLMLLALVSQFLANNGFSSSSRIFNTERKKRPKSEGWVGTLGRDYTAGLPPLETIFKQWEEEHKTGHQSEDDDSTTSDAEVGTGSKRAMSSSDDDSSGSSDSDSEKASKTNPSQAVTKTPLKRPASSSASTSESGSDSDADSDVDDEVVVGKTTGSKPNPLKRKAADTSSSSSDSSSSSSDDSSEDDSGSSEDETPVAKKARVEPSESESSGSTSDSDADRLELAANVKLPSSDSSDASTSDDDSSEATSSSEESESEDEAPKLNGVTNSEERLSDSSGTIIGDVKLSGSRSRQNNEATPQTAQVTVKRTHVGAQPTRLAQLSAAANLDDFVSNDYVSYDYADKAYRDLVVTRGKGFTKEKNKKKRGSYRGGMIDTAGGKGFKFED